MVARFGSGGFGVGYSAKLDTDDGTYGAVKLGGRKVGVAAVQLQCITRIAGLHESADAQYSTMM